MDTPAPTTPQDVETWLRSLMPPSVAEQVDGPYPFLFGMATVKLAEAHREIARLRAQIDEAKQIAEDIADTIRNR